MNQLGFFFVHTLLVLSILTTPLFSQSIDTYGGIEYDNQTANKQQYSPFDPPGWSNDTIISQNDGKESIYPDIEVDSDTNIHVVWKDNGSSTNGIYYRKYDGSNWSTIIDLSNPGINSNSPTIATDSENNVHVVFLRWSGEPGANYNVSYKRYDFLSATWSQEYVITEDDSLGLSARPKVVTDSNLNVYVFWLDERDTPLTIWYKVNDGTGWTADTRLTNLTASPNGYFGVTVSPNDYVHVCWQDYRSGTPEIYHKVFDGSSWSAEEAVTNNGFMSVYPRVAPDDSNNIHLFYGGNAHLYYLMWDAQTQTWGNGMDFQTAFALPHADIAVDLTTGDRHVVFAEYIGYSVIFYKKYDSSTGTWETDLQLTFTTDGSYEPQVATDMNNLVYITWYDYRCGTGQEEVYVKQSLPTGIQEDNSDITLNLSNNISVYPNPFSDRLEIRLRIEDVGCKMDNISLNIYDVSGRLIKSFQLPTAYSLLPTVFKWDGRDIDGKRVSGGVYFLKLRAGKYNTTSKLLKMR